MLVVNLDRTDLWESMTLGLSLGSDLSGNPGLCFPGVSLGDHRCGTSSMSPEDVRLEDLVSFI